MIKGIGTDIVEVPRIAEKLLKNQGFRELVFSATEIAYCEKQKHPAQSYAARFAAKEAFLKAIGTGWGGSGLLFSQIEIRNDTHGKPLLYLLAPGSALLQAIQIQQMQVSLSHTAQYATATVIIL